VGQRARYVWPRGDNAFYRAKSHDIAYLSL